METTPTLFIGIGGTGREMLLKIRRRFAEDEAFAAEVDLSQTPRGLLPVHRYLHIDADVNPYPALQEPDDFVAHWTALKAHEQIDAGISRQVLDEIAANPSAYSWVFRWLDPSALAPKVPLRPLGRLAFHMAHREIRDRIESALVEIASNDAAQRLLDEYGIQAQGGPRVIIFASLAGATGSGMLLDTAFLCRSFPQVTEVRGYLFLPPVERAQPLLKANTYATLCELEHYGTPAAMGANRQFTEYWGRDASNPGYHSGPAFDFCYLMEPAVLQRGLTPRHWMEPQNCVAEAVFLECSGHPVAMRLAAAHDVRRPQFGTVTTHSTGRLLEDGSPQIQTWANIYSSMGLSSIRPARARSLECCALRLARDMVDHYSTSVTLPEGEARRRAEEAIASFGVTGPDYIAALDTRDSVRYSEDFIETWARNLADKLSSHQGNGSLASLMQAEYTALHRGAFNSEPGRHGEFPELLECNSREKLAEMEGRLGQLTAEWLEEPGGILGTVETLHEVRRILDEDCVRHLELLCYEAMTRVRKSYPAWQGTLNALHREEESRHRKSALVLARESLHHAKAHLRACAESLSLEFALRLHRHFLSTISVQELVTIEDRATIVDRGGLIARLTHARETLCEIGNVIQERLDSQDSDWRDSHVVVTPYQPGAYERYWDETQPDVQAERQRFFSTFDSADEGTHPLIKMIEELGPTQTQLELTRYAHQRFVTTEIHTDVVAQLAESARREEEVADFVRLAAPWVKPSKFATHEWRPVTQPSSYLYGRVGGHNEAYRWFDDAVHRQLATPPFAECDPRDEFTTPSAALALVYTEVGAIPLAYLQDLPYLRNAYVELTQANAGYSPHVDATVDAWPEICPL